MAQGMQTYWESETSHNGFASKYCLKNTKKRKISEFRTLTIVKVRCQNCMCKQMSSGLHNTFGMSLFGSSQKAVLKSVQFLLKRLEPLIFLYAFSLSLLTSHLLYSIYESLADRARLSWGSIAIFLVRQSANLYFYKNTKNNEKAFWNEAFEVFSKSLCGSHLLNCLARKLAFVD